MNEYCITLIKIDQFSKRKVFCRITKPRSLKMASVRQISEKMHACLDVSSFWNSDEKGWAFERLLIQIQVEASWTKKSKHDSKNFVYFLSLFL